MQNIEGSGGAPTNRGYRPLKLALKGFRGIKDGLGRDELTLDL